MLNQIPKQCWKLACTLSIQVFLTDQYLNVKFISFSEKQTQSNGQTKLFDYHGELSQVLKRVEFPQKKLKATCTSLQALGKGAESFLSSNRGAREAHY